MTQSTLAWLAALIDGEGSIMMAKMNIKDKKGYKRTIWKPRVIVTNTDPRLFDALYERTGIGKIGVKGYSGRGGRKKCFQWIMTSTESEKYLPKLIPWLVLKREQAVLLIEAIQISRANATYPGKKVNVEEMRRRAARKAEIVLLVKELNSHKGVKWEKSLSERAEYMRRMRAKWQDGKTYSGLHKDTAEVKKGK